MSQADVKLNKGEMQAQLAQTKCLDESHDQMVDSHLILPTLLPPSRSGTPDKCLCCGSSAYFDISEDFAGTLVTFVKKCPPVWLGARLCPLVESYTGEGLAALSPRPQARGMYLSEG